MVTATKNREAPVISETIDQEDTGFELFASVEGFLNDILDCVDEGDLGIQTPDMGFTSRQCSYAQCSRIPQCYTGGDDTDSDD